MHGQEAAGHQITEACYSESFKQLTPSVTVTGDDRGGRKFQWKSRKPLASTGLTIKKKKKQQKTSDWKKWQDLESFHYTETIVVPVSPSHKRNPVAVL